MQILIIHIGKTAEKYLVEGEAIYLKRLNHYCSLEVKYLGTLSKTKHGRAENSLRSQSEALMSCIKSEDWVILLDENGSMFTSDEFAAQLQKWMNIGRKRIVFITGGPYGHHPDIKSRADFVLSLSPLTFTHQMVRVIFMEQLYRAFTILKNEPYHNR